MNKTLLVIAVAALAMASCEKDRACECQYYVGGVVVKDTTYHEITSKSRAKKWCSDKSTLEKAVCKLK